jgi:hypothetical protein
VEKERTGLWFRAQNTEPGSADRRRRARGSSILAPVTTKQVAPEDLAKVALVASKVTHAPNSYRVTYPTMNLILMNSTITRPIRCSYPRPRAPIAILRRPIFGPGRH